jgi:hypothetical protein
MAGEAGAEVARAGAHKKGVDFCEVCPLEGLLQGLRAELDGFPFKVLALLLRTLAGERLDLLCGEVAGVDSRIPEEDFLQQLAGSWEECADGFGIAQGVPAFGLGPGSRREGAGDASEKHKGYRTFR